MTTPRRQSDRWVTPGVVVTGLLVLGVLVLAVLAAVTWLATQHVDPDPVLRLVVQAVAAAGGLGTFVLQLASRRTTAKVERNTGVLGNGVVGVLEQLEEVRGRHAGPPAAPEQRTGPAAQGSVSDLDQDAAGSSTLGPPRGPSYEAERYSDTPSDGLEDTAWFRQ